MKLHLPSKIVAIAVLNIISLSVLTLTWALVKKPEQTLASGSGYTATWTMKKCRVATNVGNLPIGPAGWQVDYIVPGGKSITEMWVASGWTDLSSEANFIYATQDADMGNGSCRKKSSGTYMISGQYGFIKNDTAKGSHLTFGSSTPNGWTVTSIVQ